MLEIKDYSATDMHMLPDDWKPKDTRSFYQNLHLSIGNVGKPGADLYQCIIASPQGLVESFSYDHVFVINDRNIMIFQYYDWKKIYAHLKKAVASCNAATQAEEQEKLQRYFFWEYEDHKIESE